MNYIGINNWWCGETLVEQNSTIYSVLLEVKLLDAWGILTFLSNDWIKCYQLFLGGSFEIRIYREE